MSVLSLYHQEDIEQSLNLDTQTLGASANDLLNIDVTDPHLEALEKRPKHLKVMHLNTQSMVSTFDELLLTVKEYPFDLVEKQRAPLTARQYSRLQLRVLKP